MPPSFFSISLRRGPNRKLNSFLHRSAMKPVSSFRWHRNDSLKHELLDSSTVFDFRGVEVAFRIGSHVVKYIELPGPDARPSEQVERLERFPVEHPYSCRAPAGYIQETLCRVCREGHARGGLAVTAPHSYCQAPPINPRLRHEFPINREHLHPLSAAVGGIYQPVVRDFDAVHHIELRRPRVFRVKPRSERAIRVRILLGGCNKGRVRLIRFILWNFPERPPHPLVLTGICIEHDDASVPIPVGDKQFVRLRIHEHVRRLPKILGIRVRFLVTPVSDLHHKLPVFRELQDLIFVRLAADPDIPLIVHVNAVLRLRPIIATPRPTPPSDVVALLIELHHRRPRFLIGPHNSRAMQDPYVVLLVGSRAGHLAQDPPVRHLRPRRVQLELRDFARGRGAGLCGRSLPQPNLTQPDDAGAESQQRCTYTNRLFHSWTLWPTLCGSVRHRVCKRSRMKGGVRTPEVIPPKEFTVGVR